MNKAIIHARSRTPIIRDLLTLPPGSEWTHTTINGCTVIVFDDEPNEAAEDIRLWLESRWRYHEARTS